MQPSSVCHMHRLWPIGIASSLMLPKCGMPSPLTWWQRSLDVYKKYYLCSRSVSEPKNTLVFVYLAFTLFFNVLLNILYRSLILYIYINVYLLPANRHTRMRRYANIQFWIWYHSPYSRILHYWIDSEAAPANGGSVLFISKCNGLIFNMEYDI